MSPAAAEQARRRNEWVGYEKAAKLCKRAKVHPPSVWLARAMMQTPAGGELVRVVDGELQCRRWMVERAIEIVQAEEVVETLTGEPNA